MRAIERALPWPLAAPMSAPPALGPAMFDVHVQGRTSNGLVGRAVGVEPGQVNWLRWPRHHVGHAVELRRRQADVEVGAQRPRDLRGEELAEAPAGDAPDHFADQVAVGQCVIARGRPGFPPGRLRRQHGGRLVPVVHVVDGDRLVPARDARGVRQQVADLDPRLAPGRELGPVEGDVRVEVERAAVDQHERGERGHRLGGGEDAGDRVLAPRHGAGLVGPAAPQVDDHLAVDVDGERGAEVPTRLQLGCEQLAQGVESGAAGAAQRCRVIAHEASASR